MKPVQSE